MHLRRGLDRFLHEGLYVLLRDALDAAQANPPDALGLEHFRCYRCD